MSAFPERIPVAFSMGDPNGIGPEVLLKALKRAIDELPISPIVFGDDRYLRSLNQALGVGLSFDRLELRPVGECPDPPRWGEMTATAGRYAVGSLRQATLCCRREGVPLLVTSPLNKQAAQLGDAFPEGQTEFVASFFPGSKPAMAFFSSRFHLLLATVHVPLREVASLLSIEMLVRKGGLFLTALRGLGIDRPRIAVCGLNPHASEEGLFGHEEQTIVSPALRALNEAQGAEVFQGPFPADTIFRDVVAGHYDGVVALYHDQGLIPLKLLAFEDAVNATLGLPIARTSPDHGTAFPIAGQGKANASSMFAAIEWGLRLATVQAASHSGLAGAQGAPGPGSDS